MCVDRAQHAVSNVQYTGDRLESKLFSSASGGELSPSAAVYMLEVCTPLQTIRTNQSFNEVFNQPSLICIQTGTKMLSTNLQLINFGPQMHPLSAVQGTIF